jgi:hypothetical protein
VTDIVGEYRRAKTGGQLQTAVVMRACFASGPWDGIGLPFGSHPFDSQQGNAYAECGKRYESIRQSLLHHFIPHRLCPLQTKPASPCDKIGSFAVQSIHPLKRSV